MSSKILTLKVPFNHAEKVKIYLLEKGLWDKGYAITKDRTSVYFPVTRKFEVKTKLFKGCTFHHKQLRALSHKPLSLKDVLKTKLTPAEQDKLKTAFDIVGNIAILEVDDLLEKKERIIAQALLSRNKNITTVVKKVGGHDGEFRLQKYEVIAGKKTKETIHRENNVLLQLNIENVYFSPRLAHERLRVAQQVKAGEKVLALFSGCGPYPCVIAKNAKPQEIYAVEKNPEGHMYALENIKLNKLSHVHAYCGDARVIVPNLSMTFDRIIMPLPKGAEAYLGVVFKVAKKGTVIHYYDFCLEGEEAKIMLQLDKVFKQHGVKYKLLEFVHCGQSKPHEFRVCVDVKIR